MIQRYGFLLYQSWILASEDVMLTKHRAHGDDDPMSQFFRSRYEIAAAYYQSAAKFSSHNHGNLFRHACAYVGLIDVDSINLKWENLNEIDKKKFITASSHFDFKIQKLFESGKFQNFQDMTILKKNEG
jgi:hypothetical protein